MTPSFVVLADDDRWQVACLAQEQVSLRDVPASEDQGAALRGLLREMGYVKGGLCLALPSHIVLAARINCTELPPRTPRRQGMLCLLEELSTQTMIVFCIPGLRNGVASM